VLSPGVAVHWLFSCTAIEVMSKRPVVAGNSRVDAVNYTRVTSDAISSPVLWKSPFKALPVSDSRECHAAGAQHLFIIPTGSI
jgi:hypothetical protein